MAKTAIILGATGLTGSLLLNYLLNDDDYEKIKIFGRNSIGITHPKVDETLVDLFKLEDYKNQFNADVVYCCIGTTKAKTPDKAIYQKIDKGIPIKAANLAQANEVPRFIVISSMGANPKSKLFYSRTKGEMEEAILKTSIPNKYILRPSLIKGKREDERLGEKVAGLVMDFVKPVMLGDLKKYTPISAEAIVKAMIYLGSNDYENHVIESDAIKEISETDD